MEIILAKLRIPRLGFCLTIIVISFFISFSAEAKLIYPDDCIGNEGAVPLKLVFKKNYSQEPNPKNLKIEFEAKIDEGYKFYSQIYNDKTEETKYTEEKGYLAFFKAKCISQIKNPIVNIANLKLNGAIIKPKDFSLNGYKGNFSVELKEGLNNLEFDFKGPYENSFITDFENFSSEAKLWAGSKSILIQVENKLGNKIAGAIVDLNFRFNDGDFSISGITDKDGKVIFENIPSWESYYSKGSIFVDVNKDNKKFGNTVLPSHGNKILVVVKGFGETSNIDNNDFSKGLQGWNTDKACKDCVKLVPHQEN